MYIYTLFILITNEEHHITLFVLISEEHLHAVFIFLLYFNPVICCYDSCQHGALVCKEIRSKFIRLKISYIIHSVNTW